MKSTAFLPILFSLAFFSPSTAAGADFIRGDANDDGSIDITDGVFTLSWLFAGGSEPGCLSAADANDNSSVDLSDAIYILGFLFMGGRPPAEPFPGCGGDPTEDGLGCAASTECGGGDVGELCDASVASICYPAARGSFPGVLYNHGGRGAIVGGDPDGTCEALAAAGYVGHSKLRGDSTRLEPGREDVADGLGELLEVTCVDQQRLAVMGFSRGGLYSLELAIEHPNLFDAVILMAPAPGRDALQEALDSPDLGNITSKVLVLVSENDRVCDEADHVMLAQDIANALADARVDVCFQVLGAVPRPDCGHDLFQTVDGYCEGVGDRCSCCRDMDTSDLCYWERVINFLDENVR